VEPLSPLHTVWGWALGHLVAEVPLEGVEHLVEGPEEEGGVDVTGTDPDLSRLAVGRIVLVVGEDFAELRE
jgi:hypothetical protein